MLPRSAPAALLVDFGGVLTTPVVPAVRAWCAEVGIAYRDFVGPLVDDDGEGSLLERLELGRLPVSGFERELGDRIVARLGPPGEGARGVDTAGFVHRVIGSAELDPRMLGVVDAARERGLRTAMLSNSWGNTYPLELLTPHFDDLVVSAEVGLRKPDPAIFRLAAERLGVRVEQCVFVDDLPANVAAAEALGMRGIVHVDAGSTGAAVAALVAANDDAQ